MLNVKLTNCRECALIPNLLVSIDCQLAKMANSLYLNIAYMLDTPVQGTTMSTLLHYKRILTYKSVNIDWALDYTVEEIANKVNMLTVGCKCCGESASNTYTTSTTTTIVADCRPAGLSYDRLITGYVIDADPENPIVGTGSQIDACATLDFILTPQGIPYESTQIPVWYSTYTVGETVYADNGTQDCELAPNGWYSAQPLFTSNSVFEIVNGIITQIIVCVGTTTTTTTIVAPLTLFFVASDDGCPPTPVINISAYHNGVGVLPTDGDQVWQDEGGTIPFTNSFYSGATTTGGTVSEAFGQITDSVWTNATANCE